jgi:hypothetical protein
MTAVNLQEMTMSIRVSAAAAAAALALSSLVPASGAIRCNGSYQINSQGEFESPYCQEDNLARVARARGINVTAGQIRASGSTLQDVCNRLSGDISVSDICGRVNNLRRHRCDFPPC